MERGIFLSLFVILITFISACQAITEPVLSPTYNEEECGQPIPGVINVKFKEGYDVITPEKASSLVSEIQSEKISSGPKLTPKKVDKTFFISTKKENKEIQKKIGLDRWVKITFPKEVDLYEELARWASRPEVEQADLEYYSCLLMEPNDARYGVQWFFNNTGDNFAANYTTPDADMDQPEAWEIQLGNDILIATPDTSIFWEHEDLIDNIWRNLGEDADGDGIVIQPNGTSYIYKVWENFPDPGVNTTVNRSYIDYIFDPDDVNGIDDDNNGYIDDFIGWDFGSNDNDPIYSEQYDSDTYQWHGTQTAGCAASMTNNSLGMAGSCWNCKVMAMRGGVGKAAAVQYAAENGAKIISMSWVSSYTSTMADALDYAHELGIHLLTGAGNFASSTVDGGTYNSLCFNENIICVAGSNAWDQAWPDSSYIYPKGKYSDLGAPSSGIFAATAYNHPLSKYVYASGTSLGAPLVAGTVALMISENPNLTPEEVKSILQSSLDPYSSILIDRYAGDGRLNSHIALQKAKIAQEYGSFPIAIINEYESSKISNYYQIKGTATSQDFTRYEVYYSIGHYEQDWIFLDEITTPVIDGIIYNLDFSQLPAGDIEIKLIVYDSNNQSAIDITHYWIEEILPESNQTIHLEEGWNLVSLNISGINLNSENFNSFLVAGYYGAKWELDLSYRKNDSFSLNPWQGYIVYSLNNKTINFEGTVPEAREPTMDWYNWNLVSFNVTDTFANMYFDFDFIRIHNISKKNDTLITREVSRYDDLIKGRLYWLMVDRS